MRADYQLGVALCDVPSRRAFAIFFERAGEQNYAVSVVFEQLARGEIVLRGQDFGGSHKRGLVSVLNGDDGGFERNQRFARAYIALQQAAHGNRRLHVSRNFTQHFLLRASRTKREKTLNGLANRVVQGERNACAPPQVAAL